MIRARLRIPSLLVAATLLFALAGGPRAARAECVDYTDQMHWLASLDTGDHAENVAVQGSIACLVGSFGLILADVSDPEAPQFLGQATVAGFPYGVAMDDGLACVAGATAGLHVYDITDPTAPTLLGSLDTPGSARDVAMDGALAFVADGPEGVHVIGLDDPSQPTLLGTRDWSNDCVSVDAPGGDYIYTTDEGYALDILDVTDPTDPWVVRQVPTPGNSRDVVVDGPYAFVADGWSGLAVVDIADPPNAQLIQTATVFGNFVGVAAAHGHVFAADPSKGLMVYDVRSVATEPPEMVGSVDLHGSADNVAVAGFTALTASGHSGLNLVDVTSLQSPQPISQLSVGGDAQAVDVVGAVAYVVAGQSGLVTVDLSDPLAPLVLGQADSNDTPIDIVVAGGYAYISNYHAYRSLRIVDVSDPTHLVVLSEMPSPSGPSGSMAGIAVSGDHAYLTLATAGLAVVDVSDPSSPTVTGVVDTPGNAVAVAVAGSYAYVIDRYIPGLRIIDVSDPSNPQLVASVAANDYAEDVAVHGTLVYVANGNDGLLIVDVSDPQQPQVVGSHDLLGRSSRITVADGLAYIVAGPAGYASLQVVDVTDPTAPTVVGYADTDAVFDVALTSSEVVLAGEYVGVTLLPRHCQTTTSVTTTVAISTLRAYPNPTSSQTSLRFQSAATGPVRAVVYDVAGRRVRELTNGTMVAGSHELHWNGRDDRGRQVAAGTYLVQVVAGRRTYSSSVLLLR